MNKELKTLFEIIISKCNRQMRRILNLPKQLIAVDSTTVTVGENRLKWAKLKGKKSGIKLHVALNINDFTPQKVVETIACAKDEIELENKLNEIISLRQKYLKEYLEQQ